MLKLSFISDLKGESDARAMSMAFDIVTIKHSEIDLLESQHNGARLGDQVVRYLVDDYKQAVRNGDAMPRAWVWKGKSGYVLASGVQRNTAYKELIDAGDLPKNVQTEVYLLHTQDKLLIELFTRAANVGHGGRASHDERMAHAVYAVRSLGARPKDAARYFMVSDTNINHRIRAENTRAKLQSSGVQGVQSVPISSLAELSKLDFDEGAQIKFGTLISESPVPCDKVAAVARACAKAKSSADRQKIIKGLEQEITEAAHIAKAKKPNKEVRRKVPQRPRRDKLLGELSSLASFLDLGNDREAFRTLQELQIASTEDENSVRELWGRIRFRMELILGKKR